MVSPLPLCYGSSTQRPALAGTLAGAVGPAAVLTATSRTTAITALRPHSSRNASRPSRGTAHRRSLPVKAWLASMPPRCIATSTASDRGRDLVPVALCPPHPLEL